MKFYEVPVRQERTGLIRVQADSESAAIDAAQRMLDENPGLLRRFVEEFDTPRPVEPTFTERVRVGLEGLGYAYTGAAPGCYACGLGDVSYTVEPSAEDQQRMDEANAGSFMKRSCGVCRRPGDTHLYPAHAYFPVRDGSATAIGEHVHLDVCGDCLGYIANATIPDGEE